MGYALETVSKKGCKNRNWKCDHPPKFLTNDARDVFRETSFKVAPLVDFPGEQQNLFEIFTLKRKNVRN